MPADIAPLIAAVALVSIGGVFAAIDNALVTVSPARVEDLVKDGRPGARRLRDVLTDRSKYVALTVLLRIVCETAATVFAAGYAVEVLGTPWGVVVAIGVMAVVSYVVIGVGPRTLGSQNAYSFAVNSAAVLQIIGVLLTPLTRLLIALGNAITPGKGFRNGPFATEVELREVVDMAELTGVVAAGERRMIQSVFDLGDTSAREVMVPRGEMVWIEATKTAAQATSLAVRSGHSRLPVIGENPDDVLGVVYLKDLVQRGLPPAQPTAVEVRELMREAEFIPDSKPLDKVLADMQRSRNHMALLVDEYGGIAGLVTIEDVLEEIVGEINDEYDTDETPPIEALDDGTDGYRVSSRLPVQDLAELFDVEFDEDDVETVGGLFGLVLGRVPLPGAVVELHGLELIAEGGPNRQGRVRITSVVVHRVPEKELEKKKKRKKKRDVSEAENVDTADHQPDTAERTTQLHEEAS
ncbi:MULTISPECIES: hemolysin family protein [Actinomycetes]|uniref:hemolysin family protein n=1 Tax=Actinomycetes TaxID=1760 RepID=UPI0004BEF6A8|nr:MULTISPECIES: hemolysin family protein [Actinomycetes]